MVVAANVRLSKLSESSHPRIVPKHAEQCGRFLKGVVYLNDLSQTGHFVRLSRMLNNPEGVYLQLLQMKCPFGQVAPSRISFSSPQASQVRFIPLPSVFDLKHLDYLDGKLVGDLECMLHRFQK